MMIPNKQFKDALEPYVLRSVSGATSQTERGVEDIVVPPWPTLDQVALTGLIGDFVRAASEESEADPAGILFNLLPFLGCAIGPNSFVEIGDDKHPARLFTLTVGATGRGRKGTAAAAVKKLAKLFPDGLAVRLTPGPLSSGEGLTNAVRDASDKQDKDGKLLDKGVQDKRLFVLSSEFASALAAMKRETNTLSTTLRAAWDDGDLDPLTKTNPIRATGAHICITSHITREELHMRLQNAEIYSGTMNRFLFGCVRRSKHVPNPKPLNDQWLAGFAQNIGAKLVQASNVGAVLMTEEALGAWESIYPALTADESGVLGALISRSEALAKRIALLYALLDDWKSTPVIQTNHLRAALSVVEFSRESARFLYGNPGMTVEHNKICQRVLRAISAASGGLAQTELQHALNRNVQADKLGKVLAHLQAVGTITQTQVKTSGRSKTVWRKTDGFNPNMDEYNEDDEES